MTDESSSNHLPATRAAGTATLDAGPTPQPPQLLGQGLAVEAVSQAAAMAVQDAGTYFRQVAAVSAAAMAVFTAQMAEAQKSDPWAGLMKTVTDNMTAASGLLKQVGTDASSTIQSFTAVQK